MTEQEIYQYIEMTPFRGQEPVFQGTQIRVAHIIDDLAKGMTFEQILKEHSELNTKHLQATFVFTQNIFREYEKLRLLHLVGFY